MSMNKSVTEVVAALRAERVPLAARLDAIDLAIDNLCRVFGINGAAQPLPLEAPERRKKPRLVRAAPDGGEAEARRQVLLTVLGRAPVGMTASELRKATPKMESQDRANALTVLKAKKLVKRAGNTWIKVTEAA